jgi:phosphoribosylformylglycinamidine synthase
MHDFLLEVRDAGLIAFITDNGGGGLSSSIGESARFSNGCVVELEKVPLKYEGLDQWEIWVSESQERMTVGIKPEDLASFMALAEKHAVESTVIGRYTDTGRLHITYHGEVCADVDLDLLTSQFPQWRFEAKWKSPELRGLEEPVLEDPQDPAALLLDLLSGPNVCSKEWIVRQYDHEVQGTSVIKPLVGKARDTNSDAVVIRPVLEASEGLALAQAVLPAYSRIDTYHMVACTIDEAVRRVVAVGGSPDHIGGVDNFCWPSVQYDPRENPDGTYKAAQLVRANWALRDMCRAYELPLLSGKDSMYVDGRLRGRYGETHRVSALPTLQFSCTSLVEDVHRCVTMDTKVPGDLVYVLGETRNHLGASEYYAHFGYVGRHVPQVIPEVFIRWYRALHRAIRAEMVASCHGIHRGGLGIHLAMVAMAGEMGVEVDLSKVPAKGADADHVVLYSETPGRFIITIDPRDRSAFESMLADCPLACIGVVSEKPEVSIRGLDGNPLMRLSVFEMKAAWKKTFGGLV